MKAFSLLKISIVIIALSATSTIHAQTKQDSMMVRAIIDEQISAWNKGDGVAYSAHFAEQGSFTNVLGMMFVGHVAFEQKHIEILKTVFRGTTLQSDISSFRFVGNGVAIVETLARVCGLSSDGPPRGLVLDAKECLVTRLLQVIVKEGNEWKIEAYHNVDVKAGIPVVK